MFVFNWRRNPAASNHFSFLWIFIHSAVVTLSEMNWIKINPWYLPDLHEIQYHTQSIVNYYLEMLWLAFASIAVGWMVLYGAATGAWTHPSLWIEFDPSWWLIIFAIGRSQSFRHTSPLHSSGVNTSLSVHPLLPVSDNAVGKNWAIRAPISSCLTNHLFSFAGALSCLSLSYFLFSFFLSFFLSFLLSFQCIL